MKNLPPKANPQMWANREHLLKAAAEGGEEASAREFKRMQEGFRPPIERRHRIEAAAFRRWNNLPPLNETETESPASSIPQPTTK